MTQTASGAFRVQLEVFEGPLDLLVTLIRRESLDVTRIALVQVTEPFLRALERMEEIDAGALATFCETAATLLWLKSRALLPRAPEAEEAGDADADELLARLRAYRRYRRVAEGLGRREASGLRAFTRLAPPPDVPLPPGPDEANADALAAAFRAALEEASREAPPTSGGVRPHPVRLLDRFEAIRARLLRKGRCGFREMILDGRPPDASPREFVIVSFLALLEMLRRGAVAVRQDGLFGEILIEALPGLAEAPAPGEEGSFMDELDEVS